MKSEEIRKKFFEFFVDRGHKKVPSSPLIPIDDPTLLFANAGMNQFKDSFLGKEKRSYNKAVTIQKCVRAGGKHNDLENVGYTARHLTFFEMMGNFSFGDYFKRGAIEYAWEFLTGVLKLPQDKLHASIYEEDEDAFEIWNKVIGLPKERIHRLGMKDNFWQMGDTGPCGPCSEIHIDHGPKMGCGEPNCDPGCDCDRFLEIWNLVFMEFNRSSDGKLTKLEQTGIDTGMGLERLCSVVQGVKSVFQTDLFLPFFEKLEELTGKTYSTASGDTLAAFHVLADHVRSASFIIADGCMPSNEGRGYVLRKIIRRAALFQRKLSNKNLLPSLVDVLADKMFEFYPSIRESAPLIKMLLADEVDRFAVGLERGVNLLDRYFDKHSGDRILDGNFAFKLYDTYGFPLELVKVAAREHGFEVDEAGVEKAMAKQRERSKEAGRVEYNMTAQIEATDLHTTFLGYDLLSTRTEITAIYVNGESLKNAPKGTECLVVTKESPFYAERGGQVSDKGTIEVAGSTADVLEVIMFGNAIAHKIVIPTGIEVGTKATLIVDKASRNDTASNHTATHLMQTALKKILGSQVKQAGSLVAPDYLRFDFTHAKNPTADQIKEIEEIVNEKIRENLPVTTECKTYDEAVAEGAIAIFGEKYDQDNVRVVSIPDFSTELCGGTHVKRTGDIGLFKITSVEALSTGIRRICAVTGTAGFKLFQDLHTQATQISHELKAEQSAVGEAVGELVAKLHTSQKEAEQLRKKLAAVLLENVRHQAATGAKVVYVTTEGLTINELREVALKTSKELELPITVTSRRGAELSFVVALPKSSKADLREFSKFATSELGIRCGGKSNMIQGKCQTNIGERLQILVSGWLKANEA